MPIFPAAYNIVKAEPIDMFPQMKNHLDMFPPTGNDYIGNLTL